MQNASNSITQRVGRRLWHIAQRHRVRAGVRLMGASDFEFWGRYSDAVHADLAPLGTTWLDRGKRQFEFLREQGLLPHHRLLDYGCAYMATAFHLVPFLESGNYVGVDVARSSVQRGVRRMTEAGIDRNSYQVLTATDPSLVILDGFEFDVIYAYSVLQYLKAGDFQKTVCRLLDLLTPGGVFYTTFSEARDAAQLKRKKMFAYTQEDWSEIGRQRGCSVEVVTAPNDTAMLALRKPVETMFVGRRVPDFMAA